MDLLRSFLPFSLALIVGGSIIAAFYVVANSTDDLRLSIAAAVAALVVAGCLVSPMAVLHGIYEELKSINGKMGQD